MANRTYIEDLCHQLRMPAMARDAERRATEAARQETRPLDYLIGLLETEIEERNDRRVDRRIKEAGFPILKTFEGFDFTKVPHLPEARIRELATGAYLAKAEPILLLGDPGTGKTHLATALGVEAARQGHLVRFTTAGRLVTELTEARDARELGRVVARYERIDLLVLDELAYLPLSQIDAELLFRVLGERHERRSIIVTTNLPFAEWTSIFPDPRLCRAVVDRLTHRAHIIDTGKKSIRFTETLERNNRRKEKTRDQTES
jgi:DNA replication protein DnaC